MPTKKKNSSETALSKNAKAAPEKKSEKEIQNPEKQKVGEEKTDRNGSFKTPMQAIKDKLPHATLAIIIPEYKVNPIDLSNNLRLIDSQIGVDFSQLQVLIVDDASGDGHQLNMPAIQADVPNLRISLLSCAQNGGPGMARQIGIWAANSDYVMFIDADDTLHSVGVLSLFFAAIAQEKNAQTQPSDIFLSNWIEEHDLDDPKRPGTKAYITHANDHTWMHGKCYRLDFLLQNDIRFDADLRVQEDTKFNGVAFALSNKTTNLDRMATYVWRYRKDSITRREGSMYSYDSIDCFITAVDRFCNELSTKYAQQMEAKHADIHGSILQVMFYIYFILEGWDATHRNQYGAAVEKRIAGFYRKYEKYFKAAPQEEILLQFNQERQRDIARGPLFMEKETFWQFLDRILAQYPAEAPAAERIGVVAPAEAYDTSYTEEAGRHAEKDSKTAATTGQEEKK
jgi:glycosyltransferase involved in cell wall biosynthesis